VGWRAPTIPVGHRGHDFPAIPVSPTPGMPLAHPQEHGSLAYLQRPRQHVIQDLYPSLFFGAHYQFLHGLTFSLSNNNMLADLD